MTSLTPFAIKLDVEFFPHAQTPSRLPTHGSRAGPPVPACPLTDHAPQWPAPAHPRVTPHQHDHACTRQHACARLTMSMTIDNDDL